MCSPSGPNEARNRVGASQRSRLPRRPFARCGRALVALVAPAGIALLASCASTTAPRPGLLPEIRSALADGSERTAPALPPALTQALVPPPDLSLPNQAPRQAEPRFDLNVVDMPVTQIFAALAQDTRYSMLVDAELKGNVTVNLKDVTLAEALDTLRDVYGFEYRIQGSRIFVQPARLQTRVFQVSYLVGSRSGRSDVHVTSGSITSSSGGSTGGGSSNGSGAGGSGAATTTAQESSRITTQTRNDLWGELEATLKLLVGDKDGRQLIVSPQSNVIVARAYPKELRQIDEYLRASRLNVERQVMLEAKIIDVRLTRAAQSGVNWGAFRIGDGSRGSVGTLTPGVKLSPTDALTNGTLTATPGSTLELATTASSGLFGLAFQTANFASLLQFLESQGDLQVLSSPRIATINNQKAVLKVGTDDFFVTGVSTNVSSASSSNGQALITPTITVQPFFSGVALDVTPQIDDDGNITLHVHPSVSTVAERSKVVNLGTLGSYTLPLASSSVSETDTIVRVRDGHIVAIGGLMKTSLANDRSGLPGATSVAYARNILGSAQESSIKSELVILLKPTVIHSSGQLDAARDAALERLEQLSTLR